MELEAIDIIFWAVIALIAVGGIVCLLIFLPREHAYEEKRENCYRIEYRDGSYRISRKKPRYGENTFSIRSKFFYITQVPFTVDAFCDEAAGKDGKRYRAAAAATVYFPEDMLQTFAENFHNMSKETISETIEEALSSTLTDTMRAFDGSEDTKEFSEVFKKNAGEKLKAFGLIVMSVNSLNISELK